MRNRLPFVQLLAALLSVLFSSSSFAADQENLVLFCRGDAQRNDDPNGADVNIRYIHEEGQVIVDFDRRQITFMDWGVVPLEIVRDDLIRGSEGTFEFGKDQNGSSVWLYRLTGEANARLWRHDAKQKATWYPRLFAGTCERVKKKF